MGEISRNMEACLVYAARYAHARQTGASLQVVGAILEKWDSLSNEAKVQLKKEAENEAVCNLEDWELIIKKEL